MEFTYIAYSKDRKLVKGRLSAADDKAASDYWTQAVFG